MDEEWKPVTGYEDIYEVSSIGRVKRLAGVILSRNLYGPIEKPWKERILKPVQRKNNYPYVSLCVDGIIKSRTIHSLVCEAFNGPCPAGLECAHLDGTKDNNTPENLRWVTRTENQSHKKLHGTHLFGEGHPMAILSNADVIEIKRRRANNETYKSIAKDFSNVGISTLSMAANGHNWKTIQ